MTFSSPSRNPSSNNKERNRSPDTATGSMFVIDYLLKLTGHQSYPINTHFPCLFGTYLIRLRPVVCANFRSSSSLILKSWFSFVVSVMTFDFSLLKRFERLHFISSTFFSNCETLQIFSMLKKCEWQISYFLKDSGIIVDFHGNEIIRLKFVKDFALIDSMLCQLSHSKMKVRVSVAGTLNFYLSLRH